MGDTHLQCIHAIGIILIKGVNKQKGQSLQQLEHITVIGLGVKTAV